MIHEVCSKRDIGGYETATWPIGLRKTAYEKNNSGKNIFHNIENLHGVSEDQSNIDWLLQF